MGYALKQKTDGSATFFNATSGNSVMNLDGDDMVSVSGAIKVDPDSPSYSWRDLEGPIIANATGPNRPVLATYDGEIEDYVFDANDHYSVIKYHIPHDYVLGTNLFIHTHWSHNGTNISGQLVIDHRFTYAKGHGQAAFHAEKALVQTIASLNATNTPTKRHRIDEIQLSTSGGSASQIDTDLLEPDGLIILHFNVPTIPTITGGAAKPFIHYVDVHYQSSNIGTKNKSPDFYA
jgi:hypothetical protein